MGISTRAKLIFGVGYDELSEIENLDEMLDDGALDYASPYYDSGRDGWIIGIALPSRMASDIEMLSKIRAAKEEFEGLTSCYTGQIIVSTHVT